MALDPSRSCKSASFWSVWASLSGRVLDSVRLGDLDFITPTLSLSVPSFFSYQSEI